MSHRRAHRPARTPARRLAHPAAAGLAAALALPLVTLPGRAAAAAPAVAPASSTTSSTSEVLRVPAYKVVTEGLTTSDAAALAERAGIRPALRADGSFSFTDPARYGRVPSVVAGKGRDEHGRSTVATRVDLAALDRIQVPSEGQAIESAQRLLPMPAGYQSTPVVGHTTVTQSDRNGRTLRSVALDTTVSFSLTLGNLPVVGPGAKAKVAFDTKGVAALTRSLRTVAASDSVAVISPDAALRRCTQLYPRGTQQLAPVLAYYAPPLSASNASGRGRVRLIAPSYVCRPVLPGLAERGQEGLTGRLVPAAPELTPSVRASASSDGASVTASAKVSGGNGPYTVSWSSSSTPLVKGGTSVKYRMLARRPARPETLTVTVTDANGIASLAALSLPRPGTKASATASGGPGGLGGAFASTGIEQTVDEWGCAQASANGFRSVMQSKAQTVAFDWRGNNAWEKDFKKPSAGGLDATYSDHVDAQWYTGHGSPNSFTFKTDHDDRDLVPGDARWGDGDLEWLQLESCQVLRDTNGANDYFGRWGGTFNGLHLLNGFDTNATCVDGGTGARFAQYLFPQDFLFVKIPALTVQQAWARMADDLEPAGTRWRTISAAGPGWTSNLDDHFWGQGTTGPDYRGSQLIGWWAVSGVA